MFKRSSLRALVADLVAVAGTQAVAVVVVVLLALLR